MISTQYDFLVPKSGDNMEKHASVTGTTDEPGGRQHPSQGKEITCFFCFFWEAFPKNLRGQEGISGGFWEQRMALIISSGLQAPPESLFLFPTPCPRTAAFKVLLLCLLLPRLSWCKKRSDTTTGFSATKLLCHLTRFCFYFLSLTWSKCCWKPVGFTERGIWRSFTFKRQIHWTSGTSFEEKKI